MSMVPVRFLVSSGMYNTGEIAGFDKLTASRLIKEGIAEAYNRHDEYRDEEAGENTELEPKKPAGKQASPSASRKKYITKKL